MLIFALDDEPLLLRSSERAIREAYPDAEVLAFESADAALAAIREDGRKPDAVFSDVEMPGMNGLDFAIRLKVLCPDARIIFVTGYSQYAVEAYQIHAHGYIIKPLRPERVREELESLRAPGGAGTDPEKLRVRCFGRFEVFWRGEPLQFERRQTKELFALLVDRAGASCTAEEIAAALWEDESDLRAAKARIRNLVNDLRGTLASIGMDDALIRRSGELALRFDRLDCDYYNLLSGGFAEINSYYGEYMSLYSWAEFTAGRLRFDAEKHGITTLY